MHDLQVSARPSAEPMPPPDHDSDLNSIVGSLPIAAIGFDASRVVRRWNSHAERVFGHSAAAAVGRSLDEIFVARQGEDTLSPWAALQAGRAWEGEMTLMHQDGHPVTVHVAASPLVGAGGVVSMFLVVAVAVTKERLSDRTLLKAVIQASPISVTLVGPDDRINSTIGGTHSSIDGDTTYVGRHLDELGLGDQLHELLARARAVGEAVRHGVTFDGRAYDATLVALPDARSGPGTVAVVATDVTDTQAEARLFQAMIENLHEGTSVLNEDGSIRYVSPAIVRMSGFSAEQMMDMGTSVWDQVHCDDREEAQRVLSDARQHPDTLFSTVLRWQHADGRWLNLEQSIVNRLADPAIAGFISVVRDVSDHTIASDLLLRRASQQQAVAALGLLALELSDRAELAEAAVVRLAQSGLRWGILYDRVADEGSLAVYACAGSGLPFHRGELLSRSTLPMTDLAFLSGEPVTVQDFSIDARFQVNSDGAAAPFKKVGSGVAVPVRLGGVTQAVLTVRSDQADDFDTQDVYFVEAVAHVLSGAMERAAFEATLRHDAVHDTLTGLPNRLLLRDRLDQAIARFQRHPAQTVALLVVDLDEFRLVNDSRGHGVGDELLVQAAQRLRQTVRPSDTVARLGGDEFAILCDGLASPAEAAAVTSRVLAVLRDPFSLASGPVQLTASIGLAFAAEGVATDSLLRDADVAMYRAKETGRDGFEVFNDSLRSRLEHRVSVEQDLRHALDRDEFVVAYQPIVDLVSGDIDAAEALLRWTHADGTQVSPAEFIPIAEETGMIVPIGAWVLRRACADAVRWNAHLPSGRATGVAVNLSAKQIGRPDLVPTVIDALRNSGLPAELLHLEITETALMEEGSQAGKTLEALHDLGVRLSIDDFGTGYSSLTYLRKYPVSALKVDRYFVAGLGKNPEDDAIVQAVIALAHSLGLSATAEGVETKEQMDRLRLLRCDAGQGYHWSKAVPFADFLDALLDGAHRPSAPGLTAVSLHRDPPAAMASGGPRTTVVLIDDSPTDRNLLRLALEESDAFAVVGEAENSADALATVAYFRPEIAILDLSLAGSNGIAMIRPIRGVSPLTSVVVLSGFLSPATVDAVSRAGAVGCFDKAVQLRDLVDQLVERFRGESGAAQLRAG